MVAIQDCVSIEIADDRMSARLHRVQDTQEKLDEQDLLQYLHETGICSGIKADTLKKAAAGELEEGAVVAQGKAPEDGTDASIEYFFSAADKNTALSEGSDFREVMEVSSIAKGEKLARLVLETPGTDGEDIFGNIVKARGGKRITVQTGKNVEFNEADLTFYAKKAGQIVLQNNKLDVLPVYEINDSISMKTGNITFIGTIVIHGDVPSGFIVKAHGDIKIFGMVEAATIIADGSVFIKEGLAGMKKGLIRAGKDIHIGYVNQGTLKAGRNVIVENSILHSDCVACDSIISKNGNAIGGVLSAGKQIKVCEAGNRLNTLTQIHFGMNEEHLKRMERLHEKKKALLETREKVVELGRQIEKRNMQDNMRLRIASLRQRNKLRQITDELNEIDLELELYQTFEGKEHEASFTVEKALYTNVTVSFGKYKQRITKDYGKTKMGLEQNEIYLRPLL